MPPAASSEPAVAVARDDRLRLARRIDWRFLLPSPVLGRVAVMAPDGDDLPAALAADGSATVTAIGLAGDDRRATAYDTVVLSGWLGGGRLAAAARAVRPGGDLVVEVESVVARRDRGAASPTGSTVRVERALGAGGFLVRTWWAWPTLGRATAFAAFDDRIGIEALVRYRAGGRPWGRLARAVGLIAGGSVLPSIVPAAVITARRGPARPTLVERRLGVDRGGPGAVRYGCLLLTPRYRASAHVVGLALDAAGRIERVAKVARLADDDSLDHEAAVLRALARAATANATDVAHAEGLAPALLDAPGLGVEVGEEPWPVLVESGIDGRRLEPALVRADRAGAATAVEGWLQTLPVVPRGAAEPPDGDIVARVGAALEAVERLADGSPAGGRLATLATRTRAVVGGLAGSALPRVFEHGDAAHPNLIRLQDGRIGAVDWERGEPDGVPLHDLTIALAYVAAAACGASRPADQATAFRDAVSGPDPWAADALDREARRVGVPIEQRPALVVVAWARSAGWLADQLGRSSPLREPDDSSASSDLGAWLVADRSVALWSVALDLAEAG
jgi:hypothetical protein